MITRYNPFVVANSKSLKKKIKNVARSTVLGTMAVVTLSGCGKTTVDIIQSQESSNSIDNNSPVKFRDSAIKRAVIDELDIKNATLDDLNNVESLWISGAKSIDDLVLFNNLKNISFESCDLDDLSVLKGIDTLESITIYDCDKFNFNDLAGLNIKELCIAYSECIDLSFLSSLNLESLTIVGIEATDFSPIQNMDSLESLSINFCPIRNTNVFSRLINLKQLDLSYTNVKDVYFMQNMDLLENVNLSNCLLSDISSLDYNPNLDTLDIRDNSISEVNLSKFPNLTRYYAMGNNELINDSSLEYVNNHQIKSDVNDTNVSEANEVREIISSLDLDGKSALEKEKIIYDYVIDSLEYSKKSGKEMYGMTKNDPKGSYMRYSLDGKGVCINYAILFDALCDEAGINAYTLTGYGQSGLFTGGGHAWNMVEIDGVYYLCDPTWSDHFFYGFSDFISKTIHIDMDSWYNKTGEDAERFAKKHIESLDESKKYSIHSRAVEAFDEDEIIHDVEINSLQTNDENRKEINRQLIHGIGSKAVICLGAIGSISVTSYLIFNKIKQEKARKRRIAAQKAARAFELNQSIYNQKYYY